MRRRRVAEYVIEMIGIAIFLMLIGIMGNELINDPFISSNTKYFVKYTMGISVIMSILYAIIKGMAL